MTGVVRIHPEELGSRHPMFEHVALAPAGARLAFIAGQSGFYPDRTISPEMEKQMARAFEHLGICMNAAGARPCDTLRITVLVVGYEEARHAPLQRELDALFGDTKPSSTLIPVADLADPRMLFEIDATVMIPDGETP
ncbi:MAG: RidA family protein [Rhodospirillaceae bacterium]|jgi:enamine deaminase RidA (YjgF/YER057c/UK114 family)|nr:RidA family protein [Rhodospirillaceae bacterium]MBT6203037.1 RidA family protein [Rhodospirillaceae bacterium]MBT6513005.1 RidA family protein [Rhodospirillaceae bacterium]MBT7615050.1 RidA family protein [Rhodospirillaceae bacterium]MBT7648396.1 RidA family protein [Rhodospirillaceae bacterium]